MQPSSTLQGLPPAEQAIMIRAAESDVAEASAWAHKSLSAGSRVKARAKIAEQKKRVWQAKHGR
jgi:hypothetical protein